MFKEWMFSWVLINFPQQKAQNKFLFEQWVSLEETFYRLQNNTVDITNKILTNFVTKYFVGYLYPETIDQSLQLSDIEDIMTVRDSYHHHGVKIKRLSNNSPDNNNLNKLIDDMRQHSYGLSMLTDIASTIALIKDITMKSIDKELFNDHYIGLDLGTWTGILLAAQYIQAIRNNFSKIDNIGLEINEETQKRSDSIASILNFWKVKKADITNVGTYQQLGIANTITHISNETISSESVSMNKDHDPFYQSLKALYAVLSQYITNNTQTFPEQIEIKLIISDQDIHMVWNKDNHFKSIQLQILEEELKKRKILWQNQSILDYISANKISILWKLQELHKVWSNVKKKIFNPKNRRRPTFEDFKKNDIAFNHPATIIY